MAAGSLPQDPQGVPGAALSTCLGNVAKRGSPAPTLPLLGSPTELHPPHPLPILISPSLPGALEELEPSPQAFLTPIPTFSLGPT